MQVADVMVRDVKNCTIYDTLDRPAQIMWDNDCGAVPVVDSENRVVGMITDRDVCMAAYTKGVPLSAVRVAEIMSRQVRSCRPEDPVGTAELTMQNYHVRRLPVVDAQGRLTGLVSMNDLARRAVQTGGRKDGISYEEVATTMAAVCQPWCSIAMQPPVVAGSASRSKTEAVLVPQRSR